MIIMIPARYESSRLPGKVLLPLKDKPILQHVYERAVKSGAGEVLVLTDDTRIESAAKGFRADVIMTSKDCLSGTDRILEAVEKLKLPETESIINVQGDEPFISPDYIHQVAQALLNHDADMATLAYPIASEEALHNPNVVKVVLNQSGEAAYFSRSVIPYAKAVDPNLHFRHIGIYGYTVGLLKRMHALPPSPTQLAESLEQLKMLYYGERIHVEIAQTPPGQDINTQEDYDKACALS